MKKIPLLSITFLALIILGVVLSPAQTAQGSMPAASLDGLAMRAGNYNILNKDKTAKVLPSDPYAADAISVTWVSPVGNDEVFNVGCQTVRLAVTVQSTEPVERVRFRYWDYKKEQYILIGNDYDPPYEIDFYTCPLNPEWNQIFARAYDTKGNESLRMHIWLYKNVRWLPIVYKNYPTLLTLAKQVINNNGGTALPTEWILSAAGPTPISGAGGVGPSVVKPGTYTLSESGGPGGYSASDWVCDGGIQNGNKITLVGGENVTCTITNDDDPGTLRIVKNLINNDGGTLAESDFEFSVNGGAAIPFEVDGQNDLVVGAGTYSVVETAVTGYETTYNNCTNVTVPNGGLATCTITNDDIGPTLTLVKRVVNNDGGTHQADEWTLTASGTGGFSGTGTQHPVLNRATLGPNPVNANVTYTLSESGPAGYNAGAWACVGGTQVGDTITLGIGVAATCIIANNDVADLAVVKDDGLTSVVAGDAIVHTYAITVTNSGAADAAVVTLSDTWPVGFAQGTVTPSQGTCNAAGGDFSCDLGTIPAGGLATIDADYTVPASTGLGVQTNSVNVSTTTQEIDLTNNSTTDDTTVALAADLGLTKTVDVPNPLVGTDVVFTIVASNSGPSNASGIVVTDLLPMGYTYVSNTVTQGTYSNITGQWDVGAVASAGSATLTLTGTVNATGNYTNNATVTAMNESDPNPANDSDSALTTPTGVVDVSITKGVNNSTPNVGTNVVFTITAANAGPSNATGLVVTDLLPSGYSYVSHVPSQGTYTSGTGVWAVGTVAPAASATLSLTASVNASGNYENTATMTSVNENDSNAANDSDSAITTPVPVVDISITKIVDDPTPNVGASVEFTITASNVGLSPASGVVVTDLLPSGYTYGSHSVSQGSYATGTGIWTVGAISSGGSATLTLIGSVNASGNYNNTASVTSVNENDPNSANDSDSASTTPVPVADLEIIKTVNNETPVVGTNVTFTIIVNNLGPSTANNVVVNDQLPTGYNYVGNTTSQGSYASGNGNWNVGTIASGSSATLTLTGTVQASGEYNNTASVTAVTENDPNEGNNSDSASTTPIPP